MTVDYKKLGLKAGLEVHQQLDTGKLFCRCPSTLTDERADFIFQRRLRPVPSELGAVDPAAKAEFEKGLVYGYNAHHSCNCLIEMDEEPPMSPDEEALRIALAVAMMLNAKIFDQTIVMRKTVIDGSNTSGFQRTALLAAKGFVELSNGKQVGIETVVLEEDASRPVEKKGKLVRYNLDRQGIPLIEISTAPDLNSPEEVKECALKIGECMRRTCKVKRGLGTIRQDLNVSITKGARIELKGVQNLEMLDVFVEREVQRQLALIKVSKELKKRGVKQSDLEAEIVRIPELENSESRLIQRAVKHGMHAYAFKLVGYAGLLSEEIQPNRRVGTELADYLRVRVGLPGLIHSDELPGYGLKEQDVAQIKKKLACKNHDAFIILLTHDEKAERAKQAVLERARQFLNGVPEETRNALEDGNSCYSRPLPGAARMYPETDIPPINLNKKLLEEVRKALPKTVEERVRLYKKLGLSEKLVEGMKLSNYACFFEKLVDEGIDAKRAAVVLLEVLKSLERKGYAVNNLREEHIEAVLRAEKEGRIAKEVVPLVLERLCAEPWKSTESCINEIVARAESMKDVDKIIEEIVTKNLKLVKERKERAVNALMGDVMRVLKGRVPGSVVAEKLREEIKKRLA
jgi:glutamyl-tRNA(Gln) amidotransferase subunit E